MTNKLLKIFYSKTNNPKSLVINQKYKTYVVFFVRLN